MQEGVARIVQVLDLLRENKSGLTVTELARETRLSKPATSRLLSSLVEAGVLERDSSGRHVLGMLTWSWGITAARQLRVCDIARPLMLEAARTGRIFNQRKGTSSPEEFCTIHVSVLRGSSQLFLEIVRVSSSGEVSSQPGYVVPAHACSQGKLMLAFMSREELEALLPAHLESFTSLTISSRNALLNELRKAREQGYSVNRHEYIEGVFGLAVPLYDSSGSPVAALGCSGMETAFKGGRPENALGDLRSLALSISSSLGYVAGAQALVS
jgi:IclR family transcriptional regulator, KDG regulon repressor